MSQECADDWVAVADGGVIYMRLWGPLTRELVDATRRLHVAALAQRPDGIGIVLDAGRAPKLPSAEIIEYAARAAAKYPEGVLAHATILVGDGLLVSTIRTALSGIFTLARSPYPRFIVASAADAIPLVRARLGAGAPDEAAMHRAFDALPSMDA